MNFRFPEDIRAEIVNNYIGCAGKEIVFLGNHKRDAYGDILSVSDDNGKIKTDLSRQGLYDTLPEALFHPIDRFDNIPANEYKERFEEELEQQRIEESNGRAFFLPYDKFIFELSTIVSQIKNTEYDNNHVLSEIICDNWSEDVETNRFIAHVKEFIPRCRTLRGNTTLITLMLRKVMADEGIKLVASEKAESFEDISPRYDCALPQRDNTDEMYLGNRFDENVLRYDIQYWNDDFCNDEFLGFVDEIGVFEDFINDWFMGIGTSIRFNITAQTLPVRLSDELSYNYLNYNTNI